jgi:hypothetical protein
LSIREDEEVAKAFGVPTTLYKCGTLVISSIPASLIGGVCLERDLHQSFGIRPRIALGPIVGDARQHGTILGPLLGVVFLTWFKLLWTQVPYLHLTMYGVIMVLVEMFMPGGVDTCRCCAMIAPARIDRPVGASVGMPNLSARWTGAGEEVR